ncbi:MAG: VIT family protein [Beijerinckiaceae bacterium]|nr:VIT family protein [Beijerinckiaceae bacterium]
MSQPPETHRIARIGWLRAAVLGANDGIISTASLIAGVASAGGSSKEVLVTGFAGLVAGAMSMAAGEFVSVSSQADTEAAELARESVELAANPVSETRELMAIYVARGVEPDLAYQVAEQLMAKDAIGAHARDELGISEVSGANPVQAAFASAISFSAGAFLPILAVFVAPRGGVVPGVSGASIVFLALLGALGAKAGGAKMLKPAIRVAFWGALAMAITAGAGALIGKAV